MPEYELRLRFTAADGNQASRLAAAWADTCAAEYGTCYAGLQVVSGRLLDSVDELTVACEWCGRAIRQADGDWIAVKGEERGYDPVYCAAADDTGRHEPPAQSGT